MQHAVVRRALGEMTLALGLTSEPEGLRDWTPDLVPETVRVAANELLRGIVSSYGNVYGGDLFNTMNAVSAQPYEGRTGVGTLLLGKHQSGHLEVDIHFKTGVRLDQTRALRKALEMTGPNLALLTDGSVATGLGHTRTDPAAEGVFEITVTGRGQWGFGTRELGLLAVDNGNPSLPRDRISKETFLDAVDRVFKGVGDGDALWVLTEAASRQQHGTMLVVRVDADAEAERLAPQALAITPRRLDASNLASLTAIDGAILVAPDAQCHAVGVILDGQATAGVGDPSRGARYNSALRYHQGAAEGTTLIVIVSEDGMINLLPNLRRRVSRSAVESAVRELVGAAVEPVVFEKAAKASARVRSLAFYLSEEQAKHANAAFEAIERAREKSLRPGETGITRVGYDELVPEPEMNDDYFLD
nr:diadenylate cyclase [Curtobacterium sp. MCBA15_016]